MQSLLMQFVSSGVLARATIVIGFGNDGPVGIDSGVEGEV